MEESRTKTIRTCALTLNSTCILVQTKGFFKTPSLSKLQLRHRKASKKRYQGMAVK